MMASSWWDSSEGDSTNVMSVYEGAGLATVRHS